MKKIYPSLYGSRRGRFFQESKNASRSLRFQRKQQVRFRPRYAGSLVRRSVLAIGKTICIVGGMGLLFWGGASAVRFWNSSPLLRVKEIVFEGDVPSALRRSLPIRVDQNILLMNPRALERGALQQYPELHFLSVRRWFDRRVVVEGKFMTPVARLRAATEMMGVDQKGTVFPLADGRSVDPALPWIEATSDSDRLMLVSCLAAWQSHVPEFYSLVKKIETDRMHRLSVDLTNGVRVDWGEVEMEHFAERAQKILRLFSMFEPRREPAGLKFVGEDRVVMDANWQKRAERTK